MSRTLPFLNACWAAARAADTAGDRTTALKRVAPLLADPACPPVLLRSAHRLAARTHIAAGRFAAGRKHLRAVCQQASLDATAQYDLGRAFEDDPYGCDHRAAVRFKQAAGLRPTDGRFHAAYGRALVRIGRKNAGVKELLAAVEVAPADSVVLTVVLDGLVAAGKPRTAQRLLDRAAFLAPTSNEIRRLRERARFAVAGGRAARPDLPAGRPKLLLFTPAPTRRPLRVVGDTAVRVDAGSRQGPHFARLKAHRGYN